MLILYLDAQNKLTCMQVITGTVNQAVVFPREVIKHAILSGACAIIMVHNHPSGNIKPSDSDIRITNTIKDVCKSLDIWFTIISLSEELITIPLERRELYFNGGE